MSRFTVRLADPHDASSFTELLRACYPTLTAPTYEPEVFTAALPSMTRAKLDLLACSLDHQLRPRVLRGSARRPPRLVPRVRGLSVEIHNAGTMAG